MNQEKLNNIKIEVEENPNIGTCSIIEHFEKHHKNGVIDLVEHHIFKNTDTTSIIVLEKDTKQVLFELEGQEGLKLNKLSEWLINYLEIEISGRDSEFIEV